MRTLVFDGRMGASGDMILGALLAAGADRDVLTPVEEALDVAYEVGTTERQGITATTVSVRLSDGSVSASHDHDGDGDHGHDDADGHGHDHSHDDADGHGHDHGHDEPPAEGHGPHRSYAEVRDVVASMGLPDPVESDALAVFELLGEAEAAVHGTDLADTHFHEVGADDAIADVVGACLLLSDIDPDRIVTTPLATGGGTVEMSHGTYPVPTPAVVEIAERADWSLRGGPVETELLTPTGAAILGHYCAGTDAVPELTVEDSGYGAGSRDVPDHPNVLRVIVGEGDGGLSRDEIAVLETNVDDVSPEILGSLQETLAEAGARDVTILPTTMKKSRPGHQVKVICKPEDVHRVARRLAEETGTLGIREHGAGHRWIADRDVVTTTVEADGTSHEVDVKVASTDGDVYDVSAEFDDALAVAAESDLAVREVMRRAESAVRTSE